MLTEISELSQGQPVNYRSLADEESEAESLDGCDDEVGKASLVVSPANIPAYHRCRGQVQNSTEFEGDKVLIEWFAGWAALNARRHRKFPAISGVAPFLSEKSDRWGHVGCSFPVQRVTILLTMRRLRSWTLISTCFKTKFPSSVQVQRILRLNRPDEHFKIGS
jgi:hypothetical protein